MDLSRGVVCLRDREIAVVWKLRGPDVLMLPVEASPSPRCRHDVGVLNVAEFGMLGLIGMPVIRPALAAWWQNRKIVRLFDLPPEAIDGLAWALDGECFDAAVSACWPGWGGVEVSDAIKMAH